YWVTPLLDGTPVRMQVDTGAAVSLVSETTFKEMIPHRTPQPSNSTLKTYTGEIVPVKGVIEVIVEVNMQRKKLPLYVIEGNHPALLGRTWLEKIKLNWQEVHLVSGNAKLQGILSKYSDVFSDGLGSMKDIVVKLTVKPGSQPKCLKARPVAYALKPKVEAELERLVQAGVLRPVTVNPVLTPEQYPLPLIEDLFSSLAGGQRFSKIDLCQAYLQMHVDPSSQDLLTIVTHKGMYQYQRLPFGITSAPALFQRAMDRILSGLTGVQSNRLKPLHDLLNKSKKWEWTKKCEESFSEVKTALAHSEALTHFNPTLPVQLACDASPYGVGAVVSHIMPSGEEKPIAFASRTLSKVECNYAQIEREALAIVFGVKKFHQFLFGRRFTLLTDHRPLTSIFGPHSGIPSLAAARMQRWALLLSAHQYDIKYRRSEHHANADGLSRLPLPTTHLEPAKAEIFYFKEVDNSPVTAAQVKKHTRTDPVMSKVLDLVLRGEVGGISPLLRPYMSRKSELTVESGCLLWGSRVIIPPPLRRQVLEELHSGHCGGVDSEIEEKANSCSSCQKLRITSQPAPLHPWQWPEEPWVRVHIDFAGPLEDHMFLVLLDAHSKWPEVEIMKSTSSVKTVEALRSIFGRFGLPQQLVTPYHPSTNGLAERFVQTMKKALKSTQGKGSLNQRLNTFLLSYRNTPHATTKLSPATAMFKRQLRTRLDLLKPQKTKETVQAQQNIQMERRLKAKHRCFRPGDKVLARNYGRGDRWLQAVVIAQTGPVS
ncbi:hypothetical protein QQF64_009543, partial [Cirrhinus molitorella]